MVAGRETLLSLLCYTRWTDWHELAKKAEVDYDSVFNMVFDTPVALQIAQKVLAAYTQVAMTGLTYTLENVSVKVLKGTVTRPIVVLSLSSIGINAALTTAIADYLQLEEEIIANNILPLDIPAESVVYTADEIVKQLDKLYIAENETWGEDVLLIHHVEDDILFSVYGYITNWCQTHVQCIPRVLLAKADTIIGHL